VRFYLLDDPATSEYARFSHVGTWTDDRVCDACGEPTSRLVEPLQVEWDEGADRIGDFSWCGYHCVVLDTVKAFLEENAFEARFGRTEVIPPSEGATRPRVPFPYHGPRISWLIPTTRLKIDEKKSGVRLTSDCSKCRQRRYTFKRDGLVLSAESWAGEKLFIIEQFGRSRATFVTERGLSMLESARFSNLAPRLAGRIETV